MTDESIRFQDVSKFYGEVLGVTHVNLSIPRGVTSLVGPNGSGKTTLMNLMTGLVRPTRGTVHIRGVAPTEPEKLFRLLGYCTSYDAFPRGITGYQFLYSFLLLQGIPSAKADSLAWETLRRFGLAEYAHRKVAAYSKGLRQRIKLAQAICHEPEVLILDEPLNGLDPMARAETMSLFREFGAAGRHVIVSSHILDEVDKISDQVILLSHGYVVAEGQIQGVRSEVKEHPMQILIRCKQPSELAGLLFRSDHVVEAKLHEDGGGLLVRTRDADRFYLTLNRMVVDEGVEIERIAPADEDVDSVYQYLIGNPEASH